MSRRIGVLVTTHDRVDDARASMEIVRGVWENSHLFAEITIVHAYNGAAGAWSMASEDRLVVVPNERTHFCGAASLLDAGIETFATRFPDVTYVIAMAADVWAYRPEWVARIVDDLAATGARLAATPWHIADDTHGLRRNAAADLLPANGLSTDFLVIDRLWACASGFFPLAYASFLDRYADLLNYAQEMPFLERHLAGCFLGAVRREMEHVSGKDPWGSGGLRRARSLLRLMDERVIDPTGSVAPIHKAHWPELGLVTCEDPAVKREIVRSLPSLRGPTLDRLRATDDLSWYNNRPA